MRQITIEEQLRAIDRAAKIASGSKESALKFLRDAGIVPHEQKPPADKARKKKQK